MMNFTHRIGLSAALVCAVVVLAQPQLAVALTPSELDIIARDITVLIDGKYPGSGVIIARQERTYYVLTAKHVIDDPQDKYKVITPDNKQYVINYSTTKQIPGVDLAILQFTSNQNYSVATLADYDLLDSSRSVFVSGWPIEENARKKPTRQFLGGIMTPQRVHPIYTEVSASEGYELFYTNLTKVGMSGGPVLDVGGRVIGIHGRVEGEQVVEQTSTGETVPIPTQLGFSLGIPVSTFRESFQEWLKQTKVELGLRIDSNPPPTQLLPITLISPCMAGASATAWANCGNRWWRVERYDDAIAAYDQAVKIHPRFYQAWFGRANVLGYMKRYQEALESYKKAREIKSDFSDAWRFQGVVLYKMGRYDESLQSFNEALKSTNTSKHLDWYWKGEVLSAMHQYAQALDSYSKALQSKPSFSGAWDGQGYVLTYLHKYEEALASYNKAVELSPSFAEAWTNKCDVLIKLKRYDNASASCEKALQIRHQDPKTLSNRGVALDRLGDHQTAITYYKMAIKYKPDFYEALRNLGDALTDVEAYGEAVSYYDKALKIEPEDYETLRNRGKALYKLRWYPEALKSFDLAIKIKRDDYVSWRNRGEVLFELKRYEETVDSYDHALKVGNDALNRELDDEVYIVWNNRGVALINLKRYKEAIASFEHAIKIKPDFQKAIDNRRQAVEALSRP